jgi:hypothetical protein
VLIAFLTFGVTGHVYLFWELLVQEQWVGLARDSRVYGSLEKFCIVILLAAGIGITAARGPASLNIPADYCLLEY